MPISPSAGIGRQLQVIANQSEPNPIPRELRGHEFLSDDLGTRIPDLYSTDGMPFGDKTVRPGLTREDRPP